jgi:two-component sensor histidine kinase
VYNHLLGSEMTRTTNLGAYLKSLCRSIAETQETAQDVTLTCACDRIILDLDTVTLLGLIVAELVANSYHHAFPDEKGTIDVAARNPIDDKMVTLTIVDNGRGFTPPAKTSRHGLSLVRRLIEQAEGTLVVDSVNGASWTIKVPAQSALPTGA